MDRRPPASRATKTPARAHRPTGLARATREELMVEVRRLRARLRAQAAATPADDAPPPQPRGHLARATHEQDAADRRFRAAFDQALVGMAFITLDDRIVRVNPHLCALLGYQQAELLTLTFGQISHPDDTNAGTPYIDALLSGGIERYVIEKRYLHKQGRPIWARATVSLVRDAEGAPEHIFALIEDIGERKRAEAERERLLERERRIRADAESASAELSRLLAVTDSALTRLSLDDMLAELLERVREVLRADRASLLLCDPTSRTLSVRAAAGVACDAIAAERFEIGTGVAGQVVTLGQPLAIEDAAAVAGINPVVAATLRSMAVVPLRLEGQVIGTLHAGTVTPRRFSEADMRLLQLVADRVAPAIDRARAHEAAERAWREAEERATLLEGIVEAMADGVLVYGYDAAHGGEMRLTRMNGAARRISGYDAPGAPELPARLDQRFDVLRLRGADGHDLAPEELPLRRLLRGDRLDAWAPMDIHARALGGHEVITSYTGALLHDAQGAISGAVLTFRDVTAQRRLERRAQEALEHLLGIAEVLVLGELRPADEAGAGAEGTIAGSEMGRRLGEMVRAFLRCERLAITAVDPATGKLTPIVVIGEEPARVLEWITALGIYYLGDYFDAESIARLRADELVHVTTAQGRLRELLGDIPHNMLFAPMCVAGEMIGLLGLDYTGKLDTAAVAGELAPVRMLARLCALVMERERLLHQRAEAQARALALQAANERMGEFLGIASHELKTPVGVIRLSLQTLAHWLDSDPFDAVPPASAARTHSLMRDLIERSERSIQQMTRLVDDLLDDSRIQADRIALRPTRCALDDLLAVAVEEARQMAPERRVRLSLPARGPAMVFADGPRVGQVIGNYLSNALKYSAPDQPVLAALDIAEGQARVTVRDGGPGIPPDEIAAIWERFYRIPGRRHESGSGVGLGLGLYISKTIIEASGGHVGVESAPGVGSTFWFTLPLAEPR